MVLTTIIPNIDCLMVYNSRLVHYKSSIYESAYHSKREIRQSGSNVRVNIIDNLLLTNVFLQQTSLFTHELLLCFFVFFCVQKLIKHEHKGVADQCFVELDSD